jgi:hypothetical protein
MPASGQTIIKKVKIMSQAINVLGMAIIASKYAAVLLIAGLTVSTGVVAGELMILTGLESNE